MGHVTVETDFQPDAVPSPFSCRVRAFLDREFSCSLGRKRETNFLALSFFRINSSGFLVLKVCKGQCLS
jgi:hypothetical protein